MLWTLSRAPITPAAAHISDASAASPVVYHWLPLIRIWFLPLLCHLSPPIGRVTVWFLGELIIVACCSQGLPLRWLVPPPPSATLPAKMSIARMRIRMSGPPDMCRSVNDRLCCLDPQKTRPGSSLSMTIVGPIVHAPKTLP